MSSQAIWLDLDPAFLSLSDELLAYTDSWGVPEGKAGPTPGEIPWPTMIKDYAAAAPAIGAWTQQSLSANATTVCVRSLKKEHFYRRFKNDGFPIEIDDFVYKIGTAAGAAGWPDARPGQLRAASAVVSGPRRRGVVRARGRQAHACLRAL